MMEKYKIQMKAYRKKRMKNDSTPYVPPDGVVFVIDTLDPGKKIPVTIVKTSVRSQRKVIESLACPECKNEMFWDANWEAFTCTKHGKKAIFELYVK
jgi:Tol biopolymer transport system component